MRKSVNEKPFYARRDNGKLHNPIQVLKSHFDSVREIYLTPDKSTLVSVSEDMLINFWDFKNSLKYENIEPYYSIRTHINPIFTLTGSNQIQNKYFIFTSGIDGVIRSVQVPNIGERCRNSEDINILMPWRAHQDMIWQISHHFTENIISSASADGSVKISKSYEELNSDKQCNFK